VSDPVPPRGCSSQAVVSAVISEVGRHTAIIIAEDVNSGEVLRCDVIVDSIASLSIVTTTREIFIEEAPEVFEVRAYDDLGKTIIRIFMSLYFMNKLNFINTFYASVF